MIIFKHNVNEYRNISVFDQLKYILYFMVVGGDKYRFFQVATLWLVGFCSNTDNVVFLQKYLNEMQLKIEIFVRIH